jgi:hypothetical protein
MGQNTNGTLQSSLWQTKDQRTEEVEGIRICDWHGETGSFCRQRERLMVAYRFEFVFHARDWITNRGGLLGDTGARSAAWKKRRGEGHDALYTTRNEDDVAYKE